MDIAARKKQSLYQRLGEEEGVRALVETFYDVIEQDEEARELHLLHLRGFGVAHSREEQFNYLSGFLGGPQHYVMKHGHSRLKEIHEHVPIGPEMRDLWLKCMTKAIEKVGIEEDLATVLMRHFAVAAETSRNMD
ncbi:group II truncated hemoglobin [Mesorhizobium sp. SP-1A]|uniref:group II truncated hemoglobin n=1 Tax=Mesorhizobium sp. SP-1A TaxID=3077840 RepID=UPI0028F6E4B9|nr:group II truncated hemoglobin [Mesorhizobium sp. SP-1A]